MQELSVALSEANQRIEETVVHRDRKQPRMLSGLRDDLLWW